MGEHVKHGADALAAAILWPQPRVASTRRGLSMTMHDPNAENPWRKRVMLCLIRPMGGA